MLLRVSNHSIWNILCFLLTVSFAGVVGVAEALPPAFLVRAIIASTRFLLSSLSFSSRFSFSAASFFCFSASSLAFLSSSSRSFCSLSSSSRFRRSSSSRCFASYRQNKVLYKYLKGFSLQEF